MSSGNQFAIRCYQLNLTTDHSQKVSGKRRENQFDSGVAAEIIDILVKTGFNLLAINIADGLRFTLHPELRRPYSISHLMLVELIACAREKGLEIMPMLNFSRGEACRHNHWIRPANTSWSDEFDDPHYWKKAFEIIDEVIALCRPERFFHIGMNEDHDRSYTQYVGAILRLYQGLLGRGLRTASWSDSSVDDPSSHIFVEKSLRAEEVLPRDIVRILGDRWTVPTANIRKIRHQGFELWAAPGWSTREQIIGFRNAALRYGATGLYLMRPLPCSAMHQTELIKQIRMYGALFS